MMYRSTSPVSSNGNLKQSQGVHKKEPTTKPKARKKWKKPKDKPKRPLSAYNFFFRHERAKLLCEMQQGPNKFEKVGFAALAKHIAPKWKQLDPESRKVFEAQAQAEQERYKIELEEWKRKQDLKNSPTPSSDSLPNIPKHGQVPNSNHNAAFHYSQENQNSLEHRDAFMIQVASKFGEITQQSSIAMTQGPEPSKRQVRRVSLPLGVIESSRCNPPNVTNPQSCEEEQYGKSQNNTGVDQIFLKQYGHLMDQPTSNVTNAPKPQRRFSVPHQQTYSDLDILSQNLNDALQGSAIHDNNYNNQSMNNERNDSFDDEVDEVFSDDLPPKPRQRQRRSMSMPLGVDKNLSGPTIRRSRGFGEHDNTDQTECQLNGLVEEYIYPEATGSQMHAYNAGNNNMFIQQRSFSSVDQELNHFLQSDTAGFASHQAQNSRTQSKPRFERQRRSMSMPMGVVSKTPEPVVETGNSEFGEVITSLEEKGSGEKSESELYEFLKETDVLTVFD